MNTNHGCQAAEISSELLLLLLLPPLLLAPLSCRQPASNASYLFALVQFSSVQFSSVWFSPAQLGSLGSVSAERGEQSARTPFCLTLTPKVAPQAGQRPPEAPNSPIGGKVALFQLGRRSPTPLLGPQQQPPQSPPLALLGELEPCNRSRGISALVRCKTVAASGAPASHAVMEASAAAAAASAARSTGAKSGALPTRPS